MKNTALTIAVITAVVLLGGCATKNDARMAEAHYQAQTVAQQQPLVSLKAQPGETIVLSGIAEFRVNRPNNNVNQFQQSYHPVWSILGNTLSAVAPLAAMGHYSVRLADTVGTYSGDNISGSYNTDVDESISNNGRMDSPDNDSISNNGRMDSPDDNSLNNTDGRMDSPDDNRRDFGNTTTPEGGSE